MLLWLGLGHYFGFFSLSCFKAKEYWLIRRAPKLVRLTFTAPAATGRGLVSVARCGPLRPRLLCFQSWWNFSTSLASTIVVAVHPCPSKSRSFTILSVKTDSVSNLRMLMMVAIFFQFMVLLNPPYFVSFPILPQTLVNSTATCNGLKGNYMRD